MDVLSLSWPQLLSLGWGPPVPAMLCSCRGPPLVPWPPLVTCSCPQRAPPGRPVSSAQSSGCSRSSCTPWGECLLAASYGDGGNGYRPCVPVPSGSGAELDPRECQELRFYLPSSAVFAGDRLLTKLTALLIPCDGGGREGLFQAARRLAPSLVRKRVCKQPA